MKAIITELSKFDWVYDYTEYLKLRQLGLKKKEHTSLNRFIDGFTARPVKNRREFIDTIHKIAYATQEYSTYLPHNLNENAFIPELQSWKLEEQTNATPHKWTYEIDSLQKAIELDSNDHISLSLFGKMVIAHVSKNQHELSSGFDYDGNPRADIELIDYCISVLKYLKDEKSRQHNMYLLEHLKKSAMEYIYQ